MSRNGEIAFFGIGTESILLKSRKTTPNPDVSFFLLSSSVSFTHIDQIIRSPGACNFNMGKDQWQEACQLSQDFDDDFDWRVSYRSQTPGAGPHSDHSPGQYTYHMIVTFFFLIGG